MNKLFLVFSLVAIMLATVACGNNDDEPQPKPDDPSGTTTTVDSEKFENEARSTAQLMIDNDFNDKEQLVQAIRKLDYIKDAIVDDEDGLVYVTTKDGITFTLDPEGLTHSLQPLDESQLQPVDSETESDCDAIKQEIETAISGSDENTEVEADVAKGDEPDYTDMDALTTPDEPEDDTIDFSKDTDFIEPVPEASAHAPAHIVGRANERITLNKYKMGIWDPWHLGGDSAGAFSAIASASDAVRGKKVSVEYISTGAGSLGLFQKYDLVFMFCHGTPKGELILPSSLVTSYLNSYIYKDKDGVQWIDHLKANKAGFRLNFSTVKNGKDSKVELLEDFVLPGSYLKSNMVNLGRTIIWACVCWGGNQKSALRQAAIGNGAPAFVGGDNSMTATGITNAFRPYIKKLLWGGNSAHCFNNGNGSIKCSDESKDGPCNYTLSHNSAHTVSYIRSYALGPVRSVLTTADVKICFIYGIGCSAGAECGIVVRNLARNSMTHTPLKAVSKISVQTKRWQNCAVVYTATVRLKGLIPETTYNYFGYVKDSQKIMYSHQADAFRTDGFSGYYRFKSLRKNWGYSAYLGDEVYENPRFYVSFTTAPFDINKNYGVWNNYSLTVSGNSISWDTYTEPYYGGCGGDWHAHHAGTINDTRDYFKVISKGWATYSERTDYCPDGPHHHDMSEAIDYYWFQKVPTTYTNRKRTNITPVRADKQQVRQYGNVAIQAPIH